jgi:protein-disulfide isomerase
MSESGKNRRDRAAAARDAANSDERRRERMIRIIGAVTVVVVVLGIIGIAVVAKNSSTTEPTALPSADASAALPAGVLPSDDERPYGVPYGTATEGAPVLEIWEDFQCPACDAVEKANGAGIEALAESGQITLVWRPTTFLDANLGNDSSARATAAWGCAIDLGKAKEYHNTVFSNQPEKEGDGYTDEQLITFASDAGITGADLDTFTQCVNDKTYAGWVANTTAQFYASSIPGTPLALLNGVEVPTETLVDKAALDKLVADTAAGIVPSAAPSPAAS